MELFKGGRLTTNGAHNRIKCRNLIFAHVDIKDYDTIPQDNVQRLSYTKNVQNVSYAVQERFLRTSRTKDV